MRSRVCEATTLRERSLRVTAFGAIALLLAPFVWAHGAAAAPTFTGLGDLPGGVLNSLAFGISADGSTVVGRSSTASGSEAFRWTSGSGMVGLGDLPGGSSSSTAGGVSADGSVVVGGSSGASGTEAFRWGVTGDVDAKGKVRQLAQAGVNVF